MSNLYEKLEKTLKSQTDYTLYGKNQLAHVKKILTHDETFKYCDKIQFIDPENYDGFASTKTIKWKEGLKFNGECKILSLMLTPEMYDPSSMFVIVKDRASISPIMYDLNTFEPLKRIILEFKIERDEDDVNNQKEAIRQELHELLDKVLDDPETYRINGVRSLLIRGNFEVYE